MKMKIAEGPRLGKKPALLIVDDYTGNLLAFRTILEKIGEVRTAASAEEALRLLLAGERFDLILPDAGMPGMGGLELLAKLDRARHEPTVIMTSATHHDAAIIAKARSFGAVDFITLPAEAEDVIRRVLVHLQPDALRKTGGQSPPGDAGS